MTTLTATASTSTITATFAGMPGNATDWIGLYRPGAAHEAFLDWSYTDGTKSGTPGIASGAIEFVCDTCELAYEVRAFHNDSFACKKTAAVPMPAAACAASDLAWFKSRHASMKASLFAGRYGLWDNPKGWKEATAARAYINVFEATGDLDVLRGLDEILAIVAAGNDAVTGHTDEIMVRVKPGWGTRYSGASGPYGPSGGLRHGSIVTDGMMAYVMAAFARIVAQRPELQAEFGQSAALYLAQAVAIIDAWAPYLVTQPTYPDGTVGATYVYPPGYIEGGVNYAGQHVPLNLSVALAETAVESWRATGNATHATTAQRVANYWWWTCSWRQWGTAWGLVWPYWPGNSASRMEDVAHGAMEVLFATTLRASGLASPLSSATRMQQLANTFLYGCLKQGGTRLANYIDGTAGLLPTADHYLSADWMALSPHVSAGFADLIANVLLAGEYTRRSSESVLSNHLRYRLAPVAGV